MVYCAYWLNHWQRNFWTKNMTQKWKHEEAHLVQKQLGQMEHGLYICKSPISFMAVNAYEVSPCFDLFRGYSLNPWLRKPMKGLFGVHFTQCWLWNFDGQILRLKWNLSIGSCNMETELFWGGNGVGITLWNFWIITMKEGMQKKMCGMLVWSTRWEQLYSWASPHILMPKCANNNRLTTLHLEYVNCSIFLKIYMQRMP